MFKECFFSFKNNLISRYTANLNSKGISCSRRTSAYRIYVWMLYYIPLCSTETNAVMVRWSLYNKSQGIIQFRSESFWTVTKSSVLPHFLSPRISGLIQEEFAVVKTGGRSKNIRYNERNKVNLWYAGCTFQSAAEKRNMTAFCEIQDQFLFLVGRYRSLCGGRTRFYSKNFYSIFKQLSKAEFDLL